MNEMIIHVLFQHVELLLKTIKKEKQHTTIVMSFDSMNEKLHNYCCCCISTSLRSPYNNVNILFFGVFGASGAGLSQPN